MVTPMVSLPSYVKQLLPLWVSAVVGGQDSIVATKVK